MHTIRETRRNAKPIRPLIGRVVAALTLVLIAPAAWAELRKVDQTVYGMDCAPCAYGVEKGIKRLNGVEEVAVSLNDGNAVVELAEDNEVSIADIRRVVSDGGFTPKEARVEVAGELSRKDGKLQLLTEGGIRYELTKVPDAADAWSMLQDAQENARLIIEGVIPADEATQLDVESVSAA